DWPKKPHVLSGKLRRLAPDLRKAGIDIAFDRQPGNKRTKIIRLTEKGRAGASQASQATRGAGNAGENATGAGRTGDVAGRSGDAAAAACGPGQDARDARDASAEDCSAFSAEAEGERREVFDL